MADCRHNGILALVVQFPNDARPLPSRHGDRNSAMLYPRVGLPDERQRSGSNRSSRRKSPSAEEVARQPLLRVNSSLVLIPAHVTTAAGVPITDLTLILRNRNCFERDSSPNTSRYFWRSWPTVIRLSASISFGICIALSTRFSFLKAVNLVSMRARCRRTIKGRFAPTAFAKPEVAGGQDAGDGSENRNILQPELLRCTQPNVAHDDNAMDVHYDRLSPAKLLNRSRDLVSCRRAEVNNR